MSDHVSTRRFWTGMLAMAILLSAMVAQAVTIYVDVANAGDPLMDGTEAHPWDTIQKGVDNLTNQTPSYGHTVVVAGGTYSNVVLSAIHSGAVDNVNTLLTTANAVITSVPATGNAINMNNGINHFVVDGFHITGAARGVSFVTPTAAQAGMIIRNCNVYSNAGGVYLSQSANVRIENCNIVFNTGYGLNLARANDLSLLNCVIAGNCTYGITEGILSSAVKASNCVFFANRVHWYDWIGPLYSGEENWTNRITAEQINAEPLCGGNIEANPGFSDLTSWNFNELMTNSPLLNSGLGGVDIGAHQNPPLLTLDNATYIVDSATGNDANPGSAESPWATITNAAARAKAGDTVLVKSGVYTGGVTIVRGGAADKVVTYRADGDVTIMASNSASGIELRRVMGVVVEGFNVDAANKAANTQCLYLNQGASNIVRNMRIHYGGTYGVHARNSLLCEIENCSIYSNSYGVYFFNGLDIVLRACDLRNNSIRGYWGVHQSAPSFVIMENCLIRNNASQGLYVGQFAGGRLVNCNIVSNGSDGIGQQGAYSTWALTNCIIAGNGGYGVREVFATQQGIISLSYCDLYGNALGNLYDITNSATGPQVLNTADEINNNAIPAVNMGNIVEDPQFRNWSSGDFNLRRISLCIDRGVDVSTPTKDYAGNPRKQGRAVDMGAYEAEPPSSGTVIVVR